MKTLLILVVSLVAVAATTPLTAQQVPDSGVNYGSWRRVDSSIDGSPVYERRGRDVDGNIIVQRAKRSRYGNLVSSGTRTIANPNAVRACDYNRSTNSRGDVLFDRANNEPCGDKYSREDDGWYQVGKGVANAAIYERRTRDNNGNLIIQRARPNSKGTLTITSTRRASHNDRQWKRAQKQEREDEKLDRRG